MQIIQNNQPTDQNDSNKPVPTKRAAMYVRMSTEHQQYSTANQKDALMAYAAINNFDVVITYADDGKSGLDIKRRKGLQQLLSDVQTRKADFDVILVYDISRWGRFQDTDAPAHYEFLCREVGIEVHYVAEQFKNDGSLTASVLKAMGRCMSGEYSRVLSVKVHAGSCRLIKMGFRQGGTAGYGLRRMMLNEQGQAKIELQRGDRKSLQTDRVILVPGPPEEIDNVRWIYRAFTEDGLQESQIAALLNQRSLKTDFDRPWTRGVVHQVLTNEKYIGHNVYH